MGVTKEEGNPQISQISQIFAETYPSNSMTSICD